MKAGVHLEAGPINEALRLIGVTLAAPDVDEFEAVGLARYRHTDDWLKMPGNKSRG